jgi:membrane fusion protein (multidrug efflux system)
VRVGERTGSLWVVQEGLKPTDRVVVEGLQKVREGTQVTTTNAPTESVQVSGSTTRK